MCYGNCVFEDYMGECTVLNVINDKNKKELGYPICFIGGNFNCPEEEELYIDLNKDGTMEELIEKVFVLKNRRSE